MNNKKGFTLVELLAAIILLGVIIGITVPAYNKYTEKTKKNSFKETLVGLNRTLELYIAERPSESFLEEKNVLDLGLDAENISSIKSGTFYVDRGTIYLKNIDNGKFCGNGTKQNLVIKEGKC